MNGDVLENKIKREDVLKYIINAIESKSWKVDEKIDSENQLSKKLNVSRSMVREAYTILEGIGILETIHGDGTYLKKFEGIDQESPLSLLMMLFNEDVKKLMQFRRVMEIGMVEPCINNIDDNYIFLLRKELEKMTRKKDYKIVSVCDIKIHMIICESIGNPFLSLVYNMVAGYLHYISENNWKNIFLLNDIKKKEELYVQHKDIVDKIIKKDVNQATDAVIFHLDYISENLNKFYHKNK